MVPQFLHATTISADVVAVAEAPTSSPGAGVGLRRSSLAAISLDSATCRVVRFDTGTTRVSRLLNAGQPPHPCAPPAPLHCPSPGHEPGSCSGLRKGAFEPGLLEASGSVEAGIRTGGTRGLVGLTEVRLKLVGRGAFRVFW